ncbi:hypothetical protein L7F22_059024 [Adiantum nelumboides]|nr:hypothetical protein [Adiantum nelumboides]
MADLQPVHRYAAGALLSLALHQAEGHQCSVPCQPGVITEPRDCSVDADHKEKTDLLWTSQHAGLLRPIYRFMKIDTKAWAGLEQTALSTDAKLHIGAFLRILSEDDEDSAPSSTTAEAKLSEAVDNLAHKFENDSSSVAKSQEDSGRHSEVLDAKEHQEGTSNEGSFRHACESHHANLDPTEDSEKLPLLREDYFASSPSGIAERESDSVDCQRESEGCKELTLRSEVVGKPQSFPIGESQIFENLSPQGSLIVEGRLLTQRRKIAVLFELLSAVVADTPAEDKEKEVRTKRGYDARQRVALRLLATWLEVKWNKVAAMEVLVAYAAMAAQEDTEENKDGKEKEVKSWAKWKRGGLIGAAAVTGGALLALTGGLAAPAIAAGLSALAPTLGTIVPVIGSTGFAAAAAAAGSTVGSVAVAASFGGN